MKLTREEVYKLIDGERAYQDKRWNRDTTSSEGIHTPQEWLTYIVDYAQEALHIGAREPDNICKLKQMDIVRKIGGMAVAAMEQNGSNSR